MALKGYYTGVDNRGADRMKICSQKKLGIVEHTKHPIPQLPCTKTTIYEYTQRVEKIGVPDGLEVENKRIKAELKRLNTQEGRLTDAYLNEAVELKLYKTKMDGLVSQRHDLERLSREIADQKEKELKRGKTAGQITDFCSRVGTGLNQMNFEERQQLLRLIVDAIVVEDGSVKVETIIPPDQNGTLRNVRSNERNATYSLRFTLETVLVKG